LVNALANIFLFFFTAIIASVFYIKIYQVRLTAWRYSILDLQEKLDFIS
jgi:hypothetical protein